MSIESQFCVHTSIKVMDYKSGYRWIYVMCDGCRTEKYGYVDDLWMFPSWMRETIINYEKILKLC